MLISTISMAKRKIQNKNISSSILLFSPLGSLRKKSFFVEVRVFLSDIEESLTKLQQPLIEYTYVFGKSQRREPFIQCMFIIYFCPSTVHGIMGKDKKKKVNIYSSNILKPRKEDEKQNVFLKIYKSSNYKSLKIALHI